LRRRRATRRKKETMKRVLLSGEKDRGWGDSSVAFRLRSFAAKGAAQDDKLIEGFG
jgi:hypothetical protein